MSAAQDKPIDHIVQHLAPFHERLDTLSVEDALALLGALVQGIITDRVQPEDQPALVAYVCRQLLKLLDA